MSTCPWWCTAHRTDVDSVDGIATSTHARKCGKHGVVVIQMHDVTDPLRPRLIEQGVIVELSCDAGSVVSPDYARELAASLTEAAIVAEQFDT
jgi:hypothetical protein